MGIHVEGIENVYLFILFVLFGELGKELDNNPMGGYSCPSYCEVDHKHVMELVNESIQDTCMVNDSLWVFNEK